MSTTATPPAVTVERRTDDKTKSPVTVVIGLPGRPKGAEPLVILKPYPGREASEVFEVELNGQKFLRSWHQETHFKGSRNFPDGLDLGFTDEWIDTGTGQPYVEQSRPQCGADAYELLRAYADGKVVLSLQERRQLAARTEQWQNDQKALKDVQGVRPGAVSPLQAIQELADARMQEQINRMVDERVKEALAAAGKGGKK